MKWLIVLIVVGAVAGSAALAVAGDAPQCPNPPAAAAAKSEKEIGDTLGRDKRVTITDVEATTSAKNRLGSVMTDPRVCFDPQGGHVSGRFKLGPVSFSAYASVAGADLNLSGRSPSVQKLDIRLGGMPSIPGISDAAGTMVAGVINQSLTLISLSRPLTAQFSAGAVTVRE